MPNEGVQSLTSRDIMGMMYAQLEDPGQGGGWPSQIGMYIPSDQASETHKWLGAVPALREWVGSRKANRLRDQGVTIENVKFEGTIEIPLDLMRRDKTAQVQVRINDLMKRANQHWRKLASLRIDGGESLPCYDGSNFFATDHEDHKSGTQSNKLSINVVDKTAPTATEFVDVILEMVQAILGFKDDQGEPMNDGASEFLVMVPINYMGVAKKALGNDFIAGGDSNILTVDDEFRIRLAVNQRLTWTDKLAAFATDSYMKPFILQEEDQIRISGKAEGSDFEHDFDAHEYGVKALRNVGPAFWQMACMAALSNAP